MEAAASAADMPVSVACKALSASRATLYRRKTKPLARERKARRESPRALSNQERELVIDTMHEERFADQPPAEIFGRLLSEGVYLCSIRTMYRVLKRVRRYRPRVLGTTSNGSECTGKTRRGETLREPPNDATTARVSSSTTTTTRSEVASAMQP